MGSLVIFTDAGAPVDPGAADISAHGARCNADLAIVANALHLAGISFGINIENGDGGRVAQYIPKKYFSQAASTRPSNWMFGRKLTWPRSRPRNARGTTTA